VFKKFSLIKIALGLVSILLLVFIFLLPSPKLQHQAHAEIAIIFKQFPIPIDSNSSFNASPENNNLLTDITNGPDGNLWFTEWNTNHIGRITTSGNYTDFPLNQNDTRPTAITSGTDGNLWFTESDTQNNDYNIGRITTTGAITNFTIPTNNAEPNGITSGPDGNLWFTESESNKIGKITPTGTITEFPLSPNSSPFEITSGPDGNLWFTEYGTNKIGRITTTGKVSEFPIPTANSGPLDITKGPDGNLWFTESLTNKIGKITPTGIISEFSLSLQATNSTGPVTITTGPDDNLWFADGGTIGSIDIEGNFQPTFVTDPDQFSTPKDMITGPDNNLWFTDFGDDQIVRATISGTTSAPTSTPIPTPTNTPLVNGHNWSGYVATGDFLNSPVSARAIIPKITCSVKGKIAIWVGYDGYPNSNKNDSVEQDGFTVWCNNVNKPPSYQLWYENFKGPILRSILGKNSNTILPLVSTNPVTVDPKLASKLQPGDIIDMFAKRISGGARLGQTDSIFYSLTVSTSAGANIGSWSDTVGEPVFMAPQYSTSECVIEHYPLPEFDQIMFQDCSAINSGNPLLRLYMSSDSDILTSVDNYTINSNGVNQFLIHYLLSN